jgi:hypothetical protein
MKKEYTDQQKALIQMRKIWDAIEAFAVLSGMDDTEAAKFASKEMNKFISGITGILHEMSVKS